MTWRHGPAPREPTPAGRRADRTFSLDVGGVTAQICVRWHAQARRASLRVGPADAGVVIVLPPRARSEDALAVARQHAGWIRDRLLAMPPRVPFSDGAIVPVSGRDRRICHRPDAPRGCRQEGEAVIVGGPVDGIPARVRLWLQAEARRALGDCVAQKVPRLGRMPARLSVRDTRSRWGSCSSEGALSFSWRLVLAPPLVLDYVVAHEMAHLLERGHGPSFWRIATDLARDLDTGRSWLRRHGSSLFRYG